MNINRLTLVGVIALLSMVSCNKEQKKETAEVIKIPGIVTENMDTSINPKDDFYNYVNGNWVKNSTIPDDESRWSGFTILRKETRKDLLSIVESAIDQDNYKEGSDQKKALLVFETKLDTASRNKAGIDPLKPLLEAIDGIKNIDDMQTIIAKTVGVSDPFFGLGSGPDLNDSSMNIAWIGPGGLGLPDRDYYLLEDEKSKERREQYVAHITRMLQFLGDNEAKANKDAKMILALETKLAEPRLNKVERRDARNYNNPRSVSQINKMTPIINWQKFIDDLIVKKDLDTIIVAQPKYMKSLQSILSKISISDIKTMMRWSTLNNAAGYLTADIEKANWDFIVKHCMAQRRKNQIKKEH